MNKLVSSWIKYQSLSDDSVEAQELEWVTEEVSIMSIRSVDDTWQFVLDVLDSTDDERIISNLAAGPLENLLASFPEKAIRLVEKEVKNNTKLKNCLKGVWQNIIPDPVWNKLQSLI